MVINHLLTGMTLQVSPKEEPFQKKKSTSSKHYFQGDMLVFRGHIFSCWLSRGETNKPLKNTV